MHLAHDVAATHKLTLDIDLRNRGPVRVFFDLSANLVISEHIYVFKVFNAVSLEQHCDKTGEAALRHLLRALHEHHHVVFLDPLVKRLNQLVIGHGRFGSRLEITVRVVIRTKHSHLMLP